jgi:hypothetical protein
LLIESSTVSLTKVQITSGGNYAQILGRKKSIIRLNDVHLRRSLGIGISCSSGSRLVLQNARITGARKYNLLASEAEMEVKTSTLGSTQNLGIGLQGAKMRVVNTTMQPSPFGVISLISKGEIRSSVLIAESLIHHGTHYGIMVAGGEAVIRNSSFKGSVNTQKIGDDSILVTGAYSSITLTDTRVLDSAGFGIALYEGAFGRISGEISRPRLGGILVHSKTSEQVVIKNTSIQNAKLGPGIVALAGNTTEIEEVEVRNCHGGGVLVGQEAVARIEKSKFHQNKGYDLSAYGQAHVTAIDLQLRDVENLSFASCAENAQIEFVSTQEAVAAKGHHGTRWFCP